VQLLGERAHDGRRAVEHRRALRNPAIPDPRERSDQGSWRADHCRLIRARIKGRSRQRGGGSLMSRSRFSRSQTHRVDGLIASNNAHWWLAVATHCRQSTNSAMIVVLCSALLLQSKTSVMTCGSASCRRLSSCVEGATLPTNVSLSTFCMVPDAKSDFFFCFFFKQIRLLLNQFSVRLGEQRGLWQWRKMQYPRRLSSDLSFRTY
jgi:hypothetical protein